MGLCAVSMLFNPNTSIVRFAALIVAEMRALTVVGGIALIGIVATVVVVAKVVVVTTVVTIVAAVVTFIAYFRST